MTKQVQYNPKNSLFKRVKQSEIVLNSTSEIRLGVKMADDKAKDCLRKHKLSKPLSVEEQIFFNKNKN